MGRGETKLTKKTERQPIFTKVNDLSRTQCLRRDFGSKLLEVVTVVTTKPNSHLHGLCYYVYVFMFCTITVLFTIRNIKSYCIVIGLAAIEK